MIHPPSWVYWVGLDFHTWWVKIWYYSLIQNLCLSHHDISFECQQVSEKGDISNRSWSRGLPRKSLQEIHLKHPPPPLHHHSAPRSDRGPRDRVTEVKRCDTVIVPSLTITRESCWGATKLLQFLRFWDHWKVYWTQQQITSVTSAVSAKSTMCVILHITVCGITWKKALLQCEVLI